MKAKDILQLFEMFEDDMEDEQLTDSKKVKGILKEVDDKRVRDLWKSMNGYDERDYMQFKGSVLKYYLGSKKTAKYLLNQQEDLVNDTRDQRMMLQRLAKYHSHFKPMAQWFRDNDVISTDETHEYFWTGLPKVIRWLI